MTSRPTRSLEEQTSALARFMPLGKLWRAFRIESTISSKLLRGIAHEMVRIDDTIRLLESEMLPDTTTMFLDEWERAVGIPDSYGCLKGTGTIAERRDRVLVKLASLGVQTASDFVDLAAVFGVVVTIQGGAYYALHMAAYTPPSHTPYIDLTDDKTARHTIVVEFGIEEGNTYPLEYPYLFGSSGLSLLECIFDRVKPANCQTYFRRKT